MFKVSPAYQDRFERQMESSAVEPRHRFWCGFPHASRSIQVISMAIMWSFMSGSARGVLDTNFRQILV